MHLIQLGTFLHHKREALGIPLAVLARKANVGRSTLWALERGENPKTGKPSRPSHTILERLAISLLLTHEERAEVMILAGYEDSEHISHQQVVPVTSGMSMMQILIENLQALNRSTEAIREELHKLNQVVQHIQQEQQRQHDEQKSQQRPCQKVASYVKYHYPVYYPIIVQDCLWKVIDENEAHERTAGAPLTGHNMLDVFFSSEFRSIVDDWEQSASRALQYFYLAMMGFFETLKYNDPAVYRDLNETYQQHIAKLYAMPDFSRMYRPNEWEHKHLQFPEDDPELPFLACKLTIKCRLSSLVKLRIQTVVQQFRIDSVQYIHEALIPENIESKVALILLFLEASPLQKSGVYDTSLRQVARLVALIKTAEEGVIMGELEQQWHPETAYTRIFNDLFNRFSHPTSGGLEKLVSTLRKSVDDLDAKGMVRKEALIDMLLHFDLNNSNIQRIFAASGAKSTKMRSKLLR
jgi:transcriptional regulator with XRE-family HTH domain